MSRRLSRQLSIESNYAELLLVGLRGRALYNKLQTKIVHEDVKHKRHKRIKEHFVYGRAWLLDDQVRNLHLLVPSA